MKRFLPPADFVLGAFFGMAIFFLILGVTSYQSDHCRQENAAAQSSPNPESGASGEGKLTPPISEDSEREEQITKYAKGHPWVCGVVGFPRMVVATMDHHEGFFVGAFTLALFGATVFLWRSTDKLWLAGERQLEHAARSTEFTRQAAEAAIQSAEATTLIATADRAWITFIQLSISDIQKTSIDGIYYEKSIGFAPIFTNKGRSPALYLQLIRPQYKIVDRNDLVTPTFVPDFSHCPEGAPIGSEQVFNGRIAAVSCSEFAAIMNKEKAVIVYGCARYKIISDLTKIRETEFCFHIHYPGMIVDADGSRPNWQIEIAGEQNRMS